MFPQLFLVVFQPIGVVVRVAREEFVPSRLLGDDHVAQVVVGVLLVTEKIDSEYAALGTLIDLKDQVHAPLRELNDLWRDGRRNSTRSPVELDDTLDIRLHLGLGENATRADRHLIAQLLLFQARVSLEYDLVNDRVLDDGDGEIAPKEAKFYIGKQVSPK